MSKKLIAFDLDGTLAESKQPMDSEMAELLGELLDRYKVAVISGGAWKQFESQFLKAAESVLCKNWLRRRKLYLLPTSGGSLYKWEEEDTIDGWTRGEWQALYEEALTPNDVAKIYLAFYKAVSNSMLDFPGIYGNQLENRGTQVTFSALGQEAPLELKEKWDPDHSKRKKLIDLLNRGLYGYHIRYGGTTSVDVTKQGIDKAYGMNKLRDLLNIKFEDMLFIGDALQPGGNDYVVKEVGIECREVVNTENTKKIIKSLL